MLTECAISINLRPNRCPSYMEVILVHSLILLLQRFVNHCRMHDDTKCSTDCWALTYESIRDDYVSNQGALCAGIECIHDIQCSSSPQGHCHSLWIQNRINDLPMFTMPWLVSSQHDCRRKMLKLWLCFGEKYPNAASVTWYAWTGEIGQHTRIRVRHCHNSRVPSKQDGDKAHLKRKFVEGR